MNMTEDDVREVFLWAVEVVSAWGGGSPRLDKAEASLDRFFDSLRAEGWDEGAQAARNEDFLADDFVETPNPYRARRN